MINTILNPDKIIFVNYRNGTNIEIDINCNQKDLDEVNLNDLNNENFFQVPIYENKDASLFVGINFLNKLLDKKDLNCTEYSADVLINKNIEDFFYLVSSFKVKTNDFIKSVPNEYKLKVERYLRYMKILSYNYYISILLKKESYGELMLERFGDNFFTEIEKKKEDLIFSLNTTERLYLELRGEI